MMKSLLGLCLLAGFAQSLQIASYSYPQYARVNNDIETIWQLPKGKPKGMLFYAHGCSHQATDGFTPTGPDGWNFEGCKKSYRTACFGLPEELYIRKVARERGYVFVAVTGSASKLHGAKACWGKNDVGRVKLALQHVRDREKLGDLPIIATGASSGGNFVGSMANNKIPYLKCVAPTVSDIQLPPSYPKNISTYFSYMPRDKNTGRKIGQTIQMMKDKQLRVAFQQVHKHPVTVEFLTKEGVGLSHDVAKNVHEALKKGGALEKDLTLMQDPRKGAWKVLVKGIKGLDNLELDKSVLHELLNVAYAEHEAYSGFTSQMLDFCEGKDPEAAEPVKTEPAKKAKK